MTILLEIKTITINFIKDSLPEYGEVIGGVILGVLGAIITFFIQRFFTQKDANTQRKHNYTFEINKKKYEDLKKVFEDIATYLYYDKEYNEAWIAAENHNLYGSEPMYMEQNICEYIKEGKNREQEREKKFRKLNSIPITTDDISIRLSTLDKQFHSKWTNFLKQTDEIFPPWCEQLYACIEYIKHCDKFLEDFRHDLDNYHPS